jgi:hypothetical protein
MTRPCTTGRSINPPLQIILLEAEYASLIQRKYADLRPNDFTLPRSDNTQTETHSRIQGGKALRRMP